MKFYHLADLHFGKSVYGLSMLDDQRHWVERFLQICAEGRPDAVLIAGDVYDRAAPGGDAVELLDHMLTELAEARIPVLLIAGNHDSGQRLSFGRTMLARQHIHIAGTAKKELDRVTFPDPDGFGPVTFWLLPYTYPEQISLLLGEELRSYDQAVRHLLELQEPDPAARNVILSHQNVTVNGKEMERGGSESMVGGVGQIDFTAYDAFDYAALGHIHSAYPAGRPEVRYAGTPLCYHLAETRQQNRGFTEVVLGRKGDPPEIRRVGVEPLHRMRWLTGTRETIYDLLRDDPGREEYMGITITDQRITPEISAYLRQLLSARGSLLLELISTWSAFSGEAGSAEAQAVESKALEELFADLYEEQSGGTPPTDDEFALMQEAGELVRNGDPHQPADPKDVERLLKRAEEMGGGGR